MKKVQKLNEELISRFSIISDHYFDDNFSKEKKENFISSNIPMYDNINSNKKIPEINNFKACIIMTMCSFIFSLSNLCGKFISFYYPEVETASVNLIRGFVLISLSHLFFMYQKLKIINEIFLNKPRNKIIILFIRSLFGASGNLLLLWSFKFMRISSAFTIFSISHIITSILAHVILKESFTKFDVASFIISFCSVCLITKPSFIFSSEHQAIEDSFVGILLVFSALICNSVSVFSTKYISKDFHFSVAPCLVGYFFIIESVLILMISGVGFVYISLVPFLLSVLLSIFFFICIYLMIIALGIGNPIKILPISYTGIVYCLIYNKFIFGQTCDFFDIFGSSSIILINILKIIVNKM